MSLFQRDLLNTLTARSATHDPRPVVIRGVRGCGKTTLAGMFAKRFAQSMEYDLSKPSDRKAFESSHAGNVTFSRLFFLRNRFPAAGRTLLFLDNLHEMPEALERLLAAPDRPETLFVLSASSCRWQTAVENDVIASEAKQPAIPFQVSARPLSFREYLSALGETEALAELLEVPCPDHAHARLLRLFHRYALTGGMPEAVSTWLETHSITATEKTFDRILGSWRELLALRAPGKRSYQDAFNVLTDAFPFAASRITFHRFGNRPLASREAAAAFRLLEDLGFVSLVYPSTGTGSDALQDHSRAPRLQFADTGMVTCFSGIRNPVSESEDLTGLFGGQVIRHLAGQELTASSGPSDSISFWTRGKNQSSAETEFTLKYQGLRLPVAVRSGEPGRLRGLHQFVDAAPHPYAVRLWAERLSVRKTRTLSGKTYYLLSLPYYLAGRIPEHLDGFMRLVGE